MLLTNSAPIPPVVSLAETWIEIPGSGEQTAAQLVVSLAETWIEIASIQHALGIPDVVSLAETWIEINNDHYKEMQEAVVSLAETWIEIGMESVEIPCCESSPSRRRGLKLNIYQLLLILDCRLPRGDVD